LFGIWINNKLIAYTVYFIETLSYFFVWPAVSFLNIMIPRIRHTWDICRRLITQYPKYGLFKSSKIIIPSSIDSILIGQLFHSLDSDLG
jgi:hypothetical protein